MLIKDTTSMERILIVKDALEGEYGKKELSVVNREYSEHFAGTGTDE